jgi:hypothetical protein
MKKILAVFGIVSIVVAYVWLRAVALPDDDEISIHIAGTGDAETASFHISYAAITDSVLTSWTSTFVQEGIDNNPFAMMIYLIDHFSRMDQARHDKCMSLDEISSSGQTNVRSSVIATCALMRKLGWDLLCYYDDDEVYLGICFSDDWEIMEGYRIENDGRRYYLKEFDTYSPVGKLKRKKPGVLYRCHEVEEMDLEPFPLVRTLPWFDGDNYERVLKWQYRDRTYTYSLRIPKQQVRWAQNLPRSLYGMAASGVLELQNVGLVDRLHGLVRNLNEYERVNFLLKFCQAKDVCRYKNDEPIKSVSEQLHEARNDCDGRSILLFCLLRSVMDYTDDDVVFVMWPDQRHLTLSLRPRTDEALEILKEQGYNTGDGFFILDAAYEGATYWGSKMDVLSGKRKIITK